MQWDEKTKGISYNYLKHSLMPVKQITVNINFLTITFSLFKQHVQQFKFGNI